MDVEQASASIDALIERRSREKANANLEADTWRASERRHNERERRVLRAEWFAFYSRLAASLRTSAERYERRAEELLEDDGRKETA